MTDWAALIAFIISVGGLFWLIIAGWFNPNIDIRYPDTFQIECTNFDRQQKKCKEDSQLFLVADLFSFWNDSWFSTVPGIVEKVSGRIIITKNNKASEASLDWKYISENRWSRFKKREQWPIYVKERRIKEP